ncbi:MAG: M1 family metallopeptidase [Fidelibacterota bacterium]|nr:MAG: M1 family metallopeptidase [Candidatus Neomarinimicrobiota bacterium]
MLHLPYAKSVLLAGMIFHGGIHAQTLTRPADYFQQEVAYRIDVTLDDVDHTLSAFLAMDYINNSPDTLAFLWFHIWPNAYRNNETACAREKFQQGSTKFYYAREEDRGYIDSLDFRTGGKILEWEYHPEWIDVAKVQLIQPLAPGDTVTIETPFFVKIPGEFSRLRHTGNHYEISQWYPKPAVYDREGWHAFPYLELGEFYSEFGTYDVRITLPQEYVIMATGDLPEGNPEYDFLDSLAAVTAEYYALEKPDGEPDKKARKKWLKEFEKRQFTEPGEGSTKTLHFHQERVHDFAWFADKRYMVQKGTLWVEDSTRAITVWALYLPKFADLWEESIEYIHDAAYWFSKWYGTYPYNHVSAASSDAMAGYAMEYPNITIVSISGSKELLETVIMHEVGHNWHYGIFGFNEREHTWLDEGITAYSEIRYWDAKYLEETGGTYSYVLPEAMNRIVKKPFTIRSILRTLSGIAVGTHDDLAIGADFTGESLTSYALVVQYKSPLVFDFLEHYLGKERNQQVWDALAETWSFAHPGPNDFRYLVETVAGEDLSWFFDDMIMTNKRLDYGVSSIKSKGDSLEVNVVNYGNLEAPVEVATLDRDGNVIDSRWLPRFAGTQTVLFSREGVQTATTDPGEFSPDVDFSNNRPPLLRLADLYLHRPVLRFMFSAPERGRSQLFYLPMIWYTGYSGALLGLIYYSDVLPPQKSMLTGNLFYSPKHGRLAGSTGLTFNRYRLGGIDQLTSRIRYADYPEYRYLRLGARAIFRKRAVTNSGLSTAVDMANQHLTTGAFDTLLWNTGSFTSAAVSTRYWDNAHALLDWDLSTRIRFVIGEADDDLSADRQATLLEGSTNVTYRYARQGRIYLRGWVGHTLADVDEIPAQYRFWLSGGLDVDLTNPLAFNRTGSGSLPVYHRYFIQDEGPSIRAITMDTPGTTAWAINFDLSSKLPLNLFADLAGTNNGNEEDWQTYIDAGVTLKLGPARVFVPLWMSWTEDGMDAAYEGWRILIYLPSLGP